MKRQDIATLAAIGNVSRTPLEIRKALPELSVATLYASLQRLEKADFASCSDTTGAYKVTEHGRRLLRREASLWRLCWRHRQTGFEGESQAIFCSEEACQKTCDQMMKRNPAVMSWPVRWELRHEV